jgi:myo-inositol-1(or 4)-monophosphatase
MGYLPLSLPKQNYHAAEYVSLHTMHNITDYLSLAKRLAREAGIYALAAQKKGLRIETKTNEFDLVTHVDKHNEEFIRSEVARLYPDHSFLGEEEGASGQGEVKWVVDPIDGTVNYAHGLPIWCVSIGVEVAGEIVCGAVYDPNRDELFSAEKGKGAYLNDERIHVSETAEFTRSLLVTGFPYNIAENPRDDIGRFGAFLHRGILVRRLGSAALDLCYVASGRFDGFYEGSLSPWDMAAASLFVSEAGGMLTHYNGAELSIYGKSVVASNGKIHQAMTDIIRSIPEN